MYFGVGIIRKTIKASDLKKRRGQKWLKTLQA